SCYRAQRDLRSFPTRRSSDLFKAVGQAVNDAGQGISVFGGIVQAVLAGERQRLAGRGAEVAIATEAFLDPGVGFRAFQGLDSAAYQLTTFIDGRAFEVSFFGVGKLPGSVIDIIIAKFKTRGGAFFGFA